MTTVPRLSTKAAVWPSSRLKTDAYVYVGLLLLVSAIWLPRLRGPIDLRWDGAVYYILGTSLAEGKGYRLLNEPGDIEAVQYPPLLPAIVAAHQWFAGTSDPIIVGHWLRLSFFLIFTLYVFAIYRLLKNYLPWVYALVPTLLCGFNFYTHFMSDLLFPEIIYGLTTILFILCNGKAGRVYPFFAGFFAIASYALRTTGIALFAAWVAESLLNREYKRAAIRLTVALVPILLWQFYIHSVESGPQYNNPAYEYQRADYLNYNVSYSKNIFNLKHSHAPEWGSLSFNDLKERFLKNLITIPTFLGETVSSLMRVWETPWKLFNMPFPIATPWPIHAFLPTLGALTLAGIGLQLVNFQWIAPFYILLSLAAMCLTPWPQQFNRYLVPLAPFLSLSLFVMLLAIKDQLQKRLAPKWKATGLGFLTSTVCLIVIVQLVTLLGSYAKWHRRVTYTDHNGNKIDYRLYFYNDSNRALDAGIDWLRFQARPGDVVATSAPHLLYLRIGLKAVMPPFEPDPVKAQALLDSVPVQYLVLNQGLDRITVDTRKYISPILERFPNLWKRVYSAALVTETGEELRDGLQIYQRIPVHTPSR